jgi:4-carboxymuconolactone decarboxylase
VSDLFEQGLAARKRVLGAEHVERALGGASDFDRGFQELVTAYCWGTVWSQPALSDKQRSLQNLCLLAALNRQHEFELHLTGALRNGCTSDEIRETLVQITVYAGVPAGVEAFRIAKRVLAEWEPPAQVDG